MKKLLYFFIFLSLFIAFNVFAASHYVRPNGGSYGSEDGSDWDNAFDGLPSTLTRGDTYYIAGGTYTQVWDLDDAESTTVVITIKKANATDNSGVTGWDAAFATTQAVVYNSSDTTYGAAVIAKRGYFTIDGVTGSGESGHGIKLRYANLSQRNDLILVRDNTANNWIVKHVEFENAGSSYDYAQWGIHKVSGGFGGWTVQYCYVHDFNTFTKHDGGDGYTIEYCYFKDNWGSSAHHSNLLSIVCADDLIFRFNIVENATNGTGGITVLGAYSTYSCSVDDVKIHNNVWFDSTSVSNGLWTTGNSADPCGMVNWLIYNNTVVNQKGRFLAGNSGSERDSGCEIKNNLFYNSSNVDIQSTEGDAFDNDYNYYNTVTSQPSGGEAGANDVTSTQISAQTFEDYDGKDFQLVTGSEAINAGADLGASYNTDILGVTRPVGASWDIGAYEFTGSAAPSGTLVVAGGIVESDVVTGGKTIIFTLTGTTWVVAAGGVFDAQRQNILDGITAATSPANGWNAEWRDKEAVTAVVRTNDTTVTITQSSQAAISGTFDIAVSQTITATIPSTAVASATQIVASPTFIVSVDTLPNVGGVGAHIVAGGLGATLTTGGLAITSP